MKIGRGQWAMWVLVAGLAWGQAWAEEAKQMTPLDIPVIGDIHMLEVGDAAPPFTLEDLAGRAVSVGGPSSDKVHLLVFWSIFCEPCKAEMPLIQRLYEKYAGKGLEVVAVAMDGEPMRKSIEGLVKQLGFTFRVVIDKLTPDESFVVADPYGVAGTPTIYIVAQDGKIVFGEVGRTTQEHLEEAIRKALGDK
ncbi:MAG: hypothetical protein Kow0092_07620 [Deferrisomatales bacterium]